MGKFADELIEELPKFEDEPRPTLADFAPGTTAWVIQRVMDDVAGDQNLRQFGASKRYTLAVIQQMAIGKKAWDKVSKADIQEFARELRRGGEKRKALKPPTINQYLSYLDGCVIHAMSSFADCEHLNNLAIQKAKPFLRKQNMISKADRRKRLPTGTEAIWTPESAASVVEQEIPRLLDYFKTQFKGKQIPGDRMADMIEFACVSGRRRGEIVGITHDDVDYEKKVYWVRNVKHQTKKQGNDKCFVLWPELEAIIKRQPRKDAANPHERIFAFNGGTVGKNYIQAKHKLGIKDLRFHDNRGAATSRWLLKLGSRDKVRKLVTGHDSEKAFDVYDRRSTEDIMNADEAIQQFLRAPVERASSR